MRGDDSLREDSSQHGQVEEVGEIDVWQRRSLSSLTEDMDEMRVEDVLWRRAAASLPVYG